VDLFPYIQNDALFLYVATGIGASWLLLDWSERIIGARVNGSMIWVALIFVAAIWPVVLLSLVISAAVDAARGD